MVRKMISSETIKADLYELGVRNGDIVFIAADLMRVGYYADSREQTMNFWLKTLLDAVGKNGTLVIPSYTKSFPRWKKDHQCVFSPNSKTTSGALSEVFLLILKCLEADIQLTHVSLGPDAKFILQDHDEKAPSYLLTNE